MNDPYKILGVSPQASDEEIKKAERYILESNEEYKEVVLP